MKSKQLEKGLEQLMDEGVAQLFTFEMGQYRPEAIPEIKSDLPLTPAEKGCASNCCRINLVLYSSVFSSVCFRRADS